MDIGSRYSVETLGFVKPVKWQQFEKVRKEDFLLSSYFAMDSFFGIIPLSFASRYSCQTDPSSYSLSDGTTIKTEDDFNVCLGSLLES